MYYHTIQPLHGKSDVQETLQGFIPYPLSAICVLYGKPYEDFFHCLDINNPCPYYNKTYLGFIPYS